MKVFIIILEIFLQAMGSLRAPDQILEDPDLDADFIN